MGSRVMYYINWLQFWSEYSNKFQLRKTNKASQYTLKIAGVAKSVLKWDIDNSAILTRWESKKRNIIEFTTIAAVLVIR